MLRSNHLTIVCVLALAHVCHSSFYETLFGGVGSGSAGTLPGSYPTGGSGSSAVSGSRQVAATGCYDTAEPRTCQLYSTSGYCQSSSRYYHYMQTNCRLTCGYCRPSGGSNYQTRPTAMPPTRRPPYNGGGGSGGGPDNLCAAVSCIRPMCGRDQIITYDEGSCCPRCMSRPDRGCAPVYIRRERVGMSYQGMTCDPMGPIIYSGCFGVCSSGSVLMLDAGSEYQKCQCCKSAQTRKTNVVMNCRDRYGATQTVFYEYDIVVSCGCQESDTCPGYSRPAIGAFSVAASSAQRGAASDGQNSYEVDQFSEMITSINNFV